MPKVETLPDGRIQLLQNLTVAVWSVWWTINIDIFVPEGFKSDGASIPRILWPILGAPIANRHLKAAIVHDFLCENATTYEQRVIGDAIFFHLLKDCGVAYWRRACLYAGVRVYARFFWTPKQVSA